MAEYTYDQYETIYNKEKAEYEGFEVLRQKILAEFQRRSKGSGTSSIVKPIEENDKTIYVFNDDILDKFKTKYNDSFNALTETQHYNVNFINAKVTINALTELMINGSPEEKKKQYDIIPALTDLYNIVNDWNSREDTLETHGCNAACSGLCSGNGMEKVDGGNPPGNHGNQEQIWTIYDYKGCVNTCSSSCGGSLTGTTDNPDASGCSNASCSSCCYDKCGPCTGNCDGGCTGGCQDQCKNGCSYSCENDCSSYCSANNCKGGCSAQCGGCGGTCQGVCGQACAGTCQYGSGPACQDCTGTCTGTCSEVCANDCGSTCTGGCSGSCKSGCTSCQGACDDNCGRGCNWGCTGTCTGGCGGGCQGSCSYSCLGSNQYN